MRRYIFLLSLVAGCTGTDRKVSYFKIDELGVVSCKVIDKLNNRLYVYNKVFDKEKDSIRFTFSVTGISFVSESGKTFNRDLPYAGKSGIYDSITEVKVFIRNQNLSNYKEVSKDLLFDTSVLLKPIFYLKESDEKHVDSLYNERFSSAGYKFYTDFKTLVNLVNSRHTSVSHRMLVRSDLKPHVVFNIPKEYISTGMNEVMVNVYSKNNSVSVTEQFDVN